MKGIEEQMKNGVVAGYPLIGLKAAVFDGSYHDVDSNEMAFKIAASMATKQLAQKGGAVLINKESYSCYFLSLSGNRFILKFYVG